MKLLGVTTDERVGVVPDVPAIAESGLPEFKNSSWFSLFTRGAIPAPVGASQLDRFWKAGFDYWRPVVQSVKLD